MVSVHPARWCTSPLGVVPAGLGGRRWSLSRRRQTSKSVSFYFPFVSFWVNMLYSFFKSTVSGFSLLLDMLVAKWVPTPCYRDAYSVGTPNWAFWGKGWQRYHETTFSPLPFWTVLFGKQKNFLFFWGVICWMLHIGRARHPGPGPRNIIPGHLSIEFINVGGWLTSGDVALDSCAQFLAVAEHRLIPSRARSIGHQLRIAGHHSIWAPACQDKIAGGHAWGWCR